MGIERLQAEQRVIRTEFGDVLGCSYRWPGGQYCVLHTDRGLIGCGLYDCSIAAKFGMAVAVARGTPERPLVEPEDLLTANVAEVSVPAAKLGIVAGMSVAAALRCLLTAG